MKLTVIALILGVVGTTTGAIGIKLALDADGRARDALAIAVPAHATADETEIRVFDIEDVLDANGMPTRWLSEHRK